MTDVLKEALEHIFLPTRGSSESIRRAILALPLVRDARIIAETCSSCFPRFTLIIEVQADSNDEEMQSDLRDVVRIAKPMGAAVKILLNRDSSLILDY